MSSSQPLDLRLPTPGCYADPERAGLDAESVFDGMTEHLFFTLGKLAPSASRHDLYMALSYAVRDRLMTRFLASKEAIRARLFLLRLSNKGRSGVTLTPGESRRGNAGCPYGRKCGFDALWHP